jgi:hypothetical protein
MELNEHIIISFLLVVIVILIFSKISISTGSIDSTEEADTTPTPTQPAKIMTQPPPYSPFNPQSSELLTEDVKKQLNDLNNQFYTNICRKK